MARYGKVHGMLQGYWRDAGVVADACMECQGCTSYQQVIMNHALVRDGRETTNYEVR